MMISGYAKTNLDEQERIIAEWKKENNFKDVNITNNKITQKNGNRNTFLFDKSHGRMVRYSQDDISNIPIQRCLIRRKYIGHKLERDIANPKQKNCQRGQKNDN